MGDPKKQRKKYEKPGHPWQKDRLQEELVFVGQYGLKNKKEVWKHRTAIARLRSRARSLLGLSLEERAIQEEQLIAKSERLGLLNKGATLDNILSLTTQDMLERRLQTLVYQKQLAKTPYQARQLIAHRHIAIDDQIVTAPGYIVPVDKEDKIGYAPRSPCDDSEHPLRMGIASSKKAETSKGGKS
ncbi:MAG: 30S ribosomal protein S4 [Promethearchaeota archaeon]